MHCRGRSTLYQCSVHRLPTIMLPLALLVTNGRAVGCKRQEDIIAPLGLLFTNSNSHCPAARLGYHWLQGIIPPLGSSVTNGRHTSYHRLSHRQTYIVPPLGPSVANGSRTLFPRSTDQFEMVGIHHTVAQPIGCHRQPHIIAPLGPSVANGMHTLSHCSC